MIKTSRSVRGACSASHQARTALSWFESPGADEAVDLRRNPSPVSSLKHDFATGRSVSVLAPLTIRLNFYKDDSFLRGAAANHGPDDLCANTGAISSLEITNHMLEAFLYFREHIAFLFGHLEFRLWNVHAISDSLLCA